MMFRHRLVQRKRAAEEVPCVPVTLSSLDNHTGVIHVWFLLLEGLAGALATCPKCYQSHTMESLFRMLQKLKDVPGPEFGIYCVNHLLLPMFQSWLRRTTNIYCGWENFATNFKQCCGLATDLIVDYLQFIAESMPSKLSQETGVHLMLQQLFWILTECVSQPTEVISRLGCACMRHLIVSAGKYFSPDLWNIVCYNLQRACSVSLLSLKQLTACFRVDSDNFYGDVGEIKVAARHDCSAQESERLRQLAYQVFLLDIQQANCPSTCIQDNERSFTFLLFPPGLTPQDSDSSVIQVPFCRLVVGLLSHQILLQVIGCMLLQGTKHMLPTLMSLLPSDKSSHLLSSMSPKPGFLSVLSANQVKILLDALEYSYEAACAFDLRPGLKVLVQKIAHTHVAANLYKQAAVSWTIHSLALFELCVAHALSLDYVKDKMASQDINHKEEPPSNDFNEFKMLNEKFRDLCETYVELAVDREGLSSAVDKMCEQPIFFLSASDKVDYPSQSQAKDESYDSSDSEHFVEENAKIYTIATGHTIMSMLNEYKRRKFQHSMPTRLREKLSTSSSKDSSDHISMRRRNSIMKDGQAHIEVFKQLIQSFIDVSLSLDDQKFHALLPIFFPSLQVLVAYSSDTQLKLLISEWLQRFAFCCNILPVSGSVDGDG